MLQDKLIDLAVKAKVIAEQLPATESGKYMGKRLIESSVDLAILYEETTNSQNREQFITGLRKCAMEVGKMRVCVIIITESGLLEPGFTKPFMEECERLNALYMKSIITANQHRNKSNEDNT